MTLDRPLCFLDLETTGVNTSEDRIVEVCVLRLEATGAEGLFQSLVDPERPIPPDATEVHHIGDADVKGQPTFRTLAPRLLEVLDGADLAGYNLLDFDIPMLAAEFSRAGIRPAPQAVKRRIVDCYLIFKRLEPHTLSGALRYYLGRELAGAHRAEADVRATAALLEAQIARYDKLPKDVGGLAAWINERDPRFVDRAGKFRWSGSEAVASFGKVIGMPLREIARYEPGFLRWMLRAHFPADTRAIAERALAGEFPTRPKGA